MKELHLHFCKEEGKLSALEMIFGSSLLNDLELPVPGGWGGAQQTQRTKWVLFWGLHLPADLGDSQQLPAPFPAPLQNEDIDIYISL